LAADHPAKRDGSEDDKLYERGPVLIHRVAWTFDFSTPLFFTGLHAQVVLTLAGCRRIIRPARFLFIATLFTTVCLLGSHGTVGAETQQHQQN
jgi:hypothetical protein